MGKDKDKAEQKDVAAAIAELPLDDLDTEADAAGAAAKPNPLKGKRMLVLGVVAFLLVLGVGLGAYFFFAKGKSVTQQPQTAIHDSSMPIVATYIDVDEFLVNLDSTAAQPHFLKMIVTLEVGSAQDADILKQNMPRIRDSFYIYLRELRVDDLRGAAGLYRLREELLLRLNMIRDPMSVLDVLFKEISIQ